MVSTFPNTQLASDEAPITKHTTRISRLPAAVVSFSPAEASMGASCVLSAWRFCAMTTNVATTYSVSLQKFEQAPMDIDDTILRPRNWRENGM